MLSQRARDQLNSIGLNYLSNNLNQIEGNNNLNDDLNNKGFSVSISRAGRIFFLRLGSSDFRIAHPSIDELSNGGESTRAIIS